MGPAMLGQIYWVSVGVMQAVFGLSVGRSDLDVFGGAVLSANRHQRLDAINLETEMVEAFFLLIALDFVLRADGNNGQIDVTVGQISRGALPLDDFEAERVGIESDQPFHVLGEKR